MKITVKIILMLGLIVMIPSVLGVIVNNKQIQKAEKISHDSLIHRVDYTDGEIRELEYKQLENGNYSALQGVWKNDTKKTLAGLTVDGGILLVKEKRYFLSFGGRTAEDTLYLKTQSENSHRNTAQLYFYPKGVVIPVRTKTGEIDYSGSHDPSDQTRDRLLFSQTILSEEELKNNVCYRKEL
ncbi:hypothetical protein [Lactococcus allomyrinae]|uniref:Uncharacterized protein n=1 Tax=Lactococcus allomyrinae TaxID=2419773 RepID=A0A387BEV4_9LACT|nr:hypothetical protein [Lactococcus allomyrinae]AYG00602.1 hypothetical protein D7I46_05535 [Lactococcus allomyrinae]